jgi:hypothetical protein
LDDREQLYYRLFTTSDIINLFIVVSEKMSLSRDFYFGVGGDYLKNRTGWNFSSKKG